MGTTTALKNIIGGGVCKFDGSSSDCTHRRGIVGFTAPITYSCNMHRYGASNFDLSNTEQKDIVIHFPSFNSTSD
jgi:hypothetical protein